MTPAPWFLEESVRRWADALQDPDNAARLSYLEDERRISRPVLGSFEIGWKKEDGRYTIPVRTSDGVLVNVRRYKSAVKSHKMLNTNGHGTPTRLMFTNRLHRQDDHTPMRRWVLVCGGEWDALSAMSAGLVAVCGSSGEGAVPNEDELAALSEHRVAVVMDNDSAGQKAAAKWAKALDGIAAEIRVVVLPAGNGVKDVNDWFMAGGSAEDLLVLIEAATVSGFAAVPKSQRSTDQLLAIALDRVGGGEARNPGGFWLAVQLRDERYPQDAAWPTMSAYQQAVTGFKTEPYTETEARNSLTSAFSQPPRGAVGAERTYMRTDSGNAERLVEKHGVDMWYVSALGRWLVWSGSHWAADDSGRVATWAKETARSMYAEAGILTDDKDATALRAWAKQSESAPKLRAMTELARTERDIPAKPSDFDRDPMLLNVGNGVLDLATGKLHGHRRADMCRRMTSVRFDPDAKAPTWERFLRRVQPNPEVRAFLQRAVGYSLTGRTDEQKMLLLYGHGANGKTTFIEVIQDLLAGYGQQLPPDSLVAKPSGGIRNDIARLDGARFVAATEFADGARLDERLIKQITGGDSVSARFLYGELFDFRPQCTIWLSSNHRPVIRETGDGIWRRMLLVPFEIRIPDDEQDGGLYEKLQEEASGVLRWAAQGAQAWLEHKLGPPPTVRAATDLYRTDSDVLGSFLQDLCETGPDLSVPKSQLYTRYGAWCDASGLKPASKIAFGRMVKERNFADERVGRENVHTWLGLGLREPPAGNGPWLKSVPGGRS